MEVWKDCKYYEGLYQVSSEGRVWNIRLQRYIKPFVKDNGYLTVALTNKYGKRAKEYVHRIVALTFIPNPNNYPDVNHIDEVKSNNRVDNLEWISHKDNCNYGNRNKIMAKKKSKKVYQYDLDGNFIKEYDSVTEAAKRTGGYKSNISACCLGKVKSACGFTWKYIKK